jgi:hypothetical protein
MAITQAIGRDTATVGSNGADCRRARGHLLEFLISADSARAPPRDPAVPNARARECHARPRGRSLWRNSTLIG